MTFEKFVTDILKITLSKEQLIALRVFDELKAEDAECSIKDLPTVCDVLKECKRESKQPINNPGYSTDTEDFKCSILGVDYIVQEDGCIKEKIYADKITPAKKYSKVIGNGKDKTFLLKHNLGTLNIVPSVYCGQERIDTVKNFIDKIFNFEIINENTVKLSFAVEPKYLQYTVTIIG